jgi:hypothetical protein
MLCQQVGFQDLVKLLALGDHWHLATDRADFRCAGTCKRPGVETAGGPLDGQSSPYASSSLSLLPL